MIRYKRFLAWPVSLLVRVWCGLLKKKRKRFLPNIMQVNFVQEQWKLFFAWHRHKRLFFCKQVKLKGYGLIAGSTINSFSSNFVISCSILPFFYWLYSYQFHVSILNQFCHPTASFIKEPNKTLISAHYDFPWGLYYIKHFENYTLDTVLLRYLPKLDPMFLSFNFVNRKGKEIVSPLI